MPTLRDSSRTPCDVLNRCAQSIALNALSCFQLIYAKFRMGSAGLKVSRRGRGRWAPARPTQFQLDNSKECVELSTDQDLKRLRQL
jgi:hypothetical protein